MQWIHFAILAATSFGVYNFFTKITADKFSPTISLMIITGTAFLVSVLGTVVLTLLGHTSHIDKSQLYRPILAGVFYGTAVIFNIIMFSKGTPVSLGSPLVVGGTTLVATILGLIILREPLNPARIAGLVAILVGLFFLARR